MTSDYHKMLIMFKGLSLRTASTNRSTAPLQVCNYDLDPSGDVNTAAISTACPAEVHLEAELVYDWIVAATLRIPVRVHVVNAGCSTRLHQSVACRPGTRTIYRICSMCTVPKLTSEFNDRLNKVSPNCGKCERCYSALHLQEGLSMAIVRANIHKHGGPWALLSAYKRKGLAALDLDLRMASIISKRGRWSRVKEGGGASPAVQTARPYYGGELGPNEHLTSQAAVKHLKHLWEEKDSKSDSKVRTAKRLRSDVAPEHQE
jgi:hypothetical protein